MSSIVIDDKTLKSLLKDALIEVLQDQPGLLRELLAEAVEDVGLTRAIMNGQNTTEVSKDAVLKALE